MTTPLPEPPSYSNGWNLVTLKTYFEELIRASDKRYEERYASSQTSLLAATNSAKEAVTTAMTAAEKAVTTAMTAADRAAAKAELAADKRFEAIDDLKKSLVEYQRESLPRMEGEALIKGLAEKMETLAALVNTVVSERQGAFRLGEVISPYLLNLATIAVVIFLHYAK